MLNSFEEDCMKAGLPRSILLIRGGIDYLVRETKCGISPFAQSISFHHPYKHAERNLP